MRPNTIVCLALTAGFSTLAAIPKSPAALDAGMRAITPSTIEEVALPRRAPPIVLAQYNPCSGRGGCRR